MSKKSKMEVDLDQDSGYELDGLTGETDGYSHRNRISFATSLNAGIKEKLKSYSFEKDVPMADIINSLIENFIEEVEEEEGEIEVYKTFKVEDS